MPVWIAVAIFAVSAALWKPLPRSRGRFRSATIFLVLWLACWFVQIPAAHDIALALLEIAALQAAAGIGFEIAVYRARLPHLAIEGVVVAGYVAILVHMLVRLGVNVTGIFATSAVATAVVGLALQDMLNNIAGGVALELEGEIKAGDYVRCADTAGWVRHIRLRHTAIDTPEGDLVILPNSFLTRSPVTILAKARRRPIPFTMAYSHNPQDLIDAVTSALCASPIPGVAADPRPSCVVQEMMPGHIVYAAIVWTTEPGQELRATSAVLGRIYFALLRHGIPPTEITYLLEMKQSAGGGAGSNANPAEVLLATPIFRLLGDDAVFELAARMRHLSFAPGEVIIRQGEAGDSMYFVTAGEAAINLAAADGGERQVSSIGPGDFFGETSLLTGESRNANAVAITRLDCFRLDKAALEGVMARHPELAEDMSVVLAHRQMELAVTREALDREAALQRESENQVQLLARIRRFFELPNSTSRLPAAPPRPEDPLRSAAPSRRD